MVKVTRGHLHSCPHMPTVTAKVQKSDWGKSLAGCCNILFFTCCLQPPAMCRARPHTLRHLLNTDQVVSERMSELSSCSKESMGGKKTTKQNKTHTHTLNISTYIRVPLSQRPLHSTAWYSQCHAPPDTENGPKLCMTVRPLRVQLKWIDSYVCVCLRDAVSLWLWKPHRERKLSCQ